MISCAAARCTQASQGECVAGQGYHPVDCRKHEQNKVLCEIYVFYSYACPVWRRIILWVLRRFSFWFRVLQHAADEQIPNTFTLFRTPYKTSITLYCSAACCYPLLNLVAFLYATGGQYRGLGLTSLSGSGAEILHLVRTKSCPADDGVKMYLVPGTRYTSSAFFLGQQQKIGYTQRTIDIHVYYEYVGIPPARYTCGKSGEGETPATG